MDASRLVRWISVQFAIGMMFLLAIVLLAQVVYASSEPGQNDASESAALIRNETSVLLSEGSTPAMQLRALQRIAELGLAALPETQQDESVRIALADAVPLLKRYLSDDDPSNRGWAALALGSTRSSDASLLEHLLGLTTDPVSSVRRRAYLALGMVAHGRDAVFPAYRRAVDDSDWKIRLLGIEGLSEYTDRVDEVVSVLTFRAEREQSELVRIRLVVTLAQLDSGNLELARLLSHLLATSDSSAAEGQTGDGFVAIAVEQLGETNTQLALRILQSLEADADAPTELRARVGVILLRLRSNDGRVESRLGE